MIPTRQEAERLLREAEICNPGPWGNHSRVAAHCAERIAEACDGMDPEKAYILGLLHDIGRKFGVRHLGHVSDGYKYMMSLGYDEAARICLTHSFNNLTTDEYIGKFDTTDEELELIRSELRKAAVDDYDRLIQLCDALAGSEGVMNIEDRMNDVRRRYGSFPRAKWDSNLELKARFEEKARGNIYDLVEKDRCVEGFVRQSEIILRDNLTGIYLHGSSVMGCFNPRKSDIDLIVVVKRPLSDPVKRAYMDMVVRYNLLGPAKGIEMSIVLGEVCKPFVYPTPFELHFSAGHLEWYRNDPDGYIRRMNGVDKDLAAHFTVILKRGRCLYGAPVREVFAEVPGCDYMDSIWNDIADAPENIAKDTMYLTLNLARVLAYKEEGLVLSKREGGEWAVRSLPAEYRPLILEALREYSGSAEAVYDEDLARRYAGYVIRRIRQETAPSGSVPG